MQYNILDHRCADHRTGIFDGFPQLCYNTPMKRSLNFTASQGPSDRSYQMRILSVIAISFVIFGHIRFGEFRTDMSALGTFYGWFPYYSFHLPLFLFISGYFYKDVTEEASFGKSFGRFVLKKARNLLLPYYIFNGIFLLLGTWLLQQGFTFLTPFSLTEWLLHPWTRLYSITFSVPTWYLISLFIAEIFLVLLRKLFRMLIHKDLLREILLLLFTLVLGVAAIYLHNTIKFPQAAQVYLRSVLMLFFIQVGIFYRRHLESHDTLGSGWYFLILFALQFLLILLSGNNPLSPGLYGLVFFETAGHDYFLAGLTGIALWLRISRLLSSIPHKSRVLTYIGSNTKYIMTFHVFGFFLLNTLFDVLKKAGLEKVLLDNFSTRTYHSYLYYADIDNPRMMILYFLAGMGFSLLMALVINALKQLPLKSRHKKTAEN